MHLLNDPGYTPADGYGRLLGHPSPIVPVVIGDEGATTFSY